MSCFASFMRATVVLHSSARLKEQMLQALSLIHISLHHALRVGGGLIHLVHGHDELDVGGLGVVDGLDRLGHDAVIGGDDQNCNIGHVGTAGAHGGECLVARGIQEGDEAVVDLDLICTCLLYTSYSSILKAS